MSNVNIVSWAKTVAGKCEAYANEGFGGFYLSILEDSTGRALLLEWLSEAEVGHLDLPASMSKGEVEAALERAAEVIRSEAKVNVYTSGSAWESAKRVADVER